MKKEYEFEIVHKEYYSICVEAESLDEAESLAWEEASYCGPVDYDWEVLEITEHKPEVEPTITPISEEDFESILKGDSNEPEN